MRVEQESYYNEFGLKFKNAILQCPDPSLWTTDYDTKGRVYQEMSARIGIQKDLMSRYLFQNLPVLDIGCGFGRQAFLLAKAGYQVVGIDTSAELISIAKELFIKHNLNGSFLCRSIFNFVPQTQFNNVILFDVLEHIRPSQRFLFVKKISSLQSKDGILIISLPHIKRRLRSQLNNYVRKRITQHLAFFRNREEHPYPIPSKSAIIRMTRSNFHLESFKQTDHSDYYVFRNI